MLAKRNLAREAKKHTCFEQVSRTERSSRQCPGFAGVCIFANEEVKARIGNAIGPYEDLLTAVERRKLK